MALKVYVAGAWAEKEERAEKFIALLREAGVEITQDWTKAESKGGDWKLTPEERLKHAHADLDGVRAADYVWLLVPTTDVSAGAWTEFGYALGRRQLTIASGPRVLRSIFTEMADYRFESDSAALEHILTRR